MAATQSQRKIQIGTAGRSEKIRTYNYNQNRITDHRVPISINNLEEFLSGGENLEDMIMTLHEESRKERLLELIDSVK